MKPAQEMSGVLADKVYLLESVRNCLFGSSES